jgi:hypothetical protein
MEEDHSGLNDVQDPGHFSTLSIIINMELSHPLLLSQASNPFNPHVHVMIHTYGECDISFSVPMFLWAEGQPLIT